MTLESPSGGREPGACLGFHSCEVALSTAGAVESPDTPGCRGGRAWGWSRSAAASRIRRAEQKGKETVIPGSRSTVPNFVDVKRAGAMG